MHKSTRALLTFVLVYSPAMLFSQPVFSPPVNLGPKINTSDVESDPFLTADGKELFFTRSLDIWVSEWSDTGWTVAQKLGPQINLSVFFQQSPSVSPDGQRLYYVDAERDGYNWDIWVSTWNPSINDWGTPVNLGPPVNTSGVEFSAHIAPDGMHLYFYSETSDPDSLNPYGRCGFYVSEWNGSSWSVPMQVAPNLGHCGNGSQYPSVTQEGMWFYYDRYVEDGKSIFVCEWDGLTWKPGIDLRSQIGGRAGTPSILPDGSRLFFASPDLGGYGSNDIFVASQINLERVPGLTKEGRALLAASLILIGIWSLFRVRAP
ncbi:MAG TPA: hypothetical protein VNL73_10470 [Verrucomicrobiae bacterium]|nr:hypothetical protein [Verrucomicrobiae bacterium]